MFFAIFWQFQERYWHAYKKYRRPPLGHNFGRFFVGIMVGSQGRSIITSLIMYACSGPWRPDGIQTTFICHWKDCNKLKYDCINYTLAIYLEEIIEQHQVTKCPQ